MTICLPERLKDEAAQEAIDAVRLDSPGSREWTLARVAASLPESKLGDVLSLARDAKDPSSRAAGLGKIAEFFADEQRAEILREVLGLLSEIPGSRQRDSVLKDVAAHLPRPLLEQAVAAAREIPDRTYSAKSLCRLADHLPLSARDDIYDEAFTRIRKIDDDLSRIHGWIEVSECLTSDRRVEHLARFRR